MSHYERFINEDLNRWSNLTTGKVYWNVLNKERRGEYLGQTVQIIPHITQEIKDFIYHVGVETNADVVITEIGGTTDDIESQPFLEALLDPCNYTGRCEQQVEAFLSGILPVLNDAVLTETSTKPKTNT